MNLERRKRRKGEKKMEKIREFDTEMCWDFPSRSIKINVKNQPVYKKYKFKAK